MTAATERCCGHNAVALQAATPFRCDPALFFRMTPQLQPDVDAPWAASTILQAQFALRPAISNAGLSLSTLTGKWGDTVDIYQRHPWTHGAKINSNDDTALRVAADYREDDRKISSVERINTILMLFLIAMQVL